MVEKWCAKLPNKFPDIEIYTYIIMPNHFHAIIINTDNIAADAVRAHLCAPPDENNEQSILGEHAGSPLRAVIQWFKTMTTNEYNGLATVRQSEKGIGIIEEKFSNYYRELLKTIERHTL
jgi:hypothetical protein